MKKTLVVLLCLSFVGCIITNQEARVDHEALVLISAIAIDNADLIQDLLEEWITLRTNLHAAETRAAREFAWNAVNEFLDRLEN